MNISSIKYINMDKDREKLYLIDKLLRKFPYQRERIEGVKCGNSDVPMDKYLRYGLLPYLKDQTETRQKGVLGCWIAHARALESVTETDGITVVLEDDFVCKDGFFDRAISMINNFDKDFDVILFDPKGTGPLAKHAIAPCIYDVEGCSYPEYMGSQCLFYNNKRVPYIRDTILDSHVRDFDGYILYEKKIKSYVFYTGLSRSIYFYSDVQGEEYRNSFWYGMTEWIEYVCDWDGKVVDKRVSA